jgi:serine protease Do
MRRPAPAFFLAFGLALLAGCRDANRPADAGRAAPQDTTATVPVPAGKYGTFPQIFADVAEGALPAVVSVYTETDGSVPGQGDPFGGFFGGPYGSGEGSLPPQESGLGSGVIMSEDGTILTNNHVIEGATRIRVQLYDGREFDAAVVGADPPTDLAVIRITRVTGSSGGARGKPGLIGRLFQGGGEKFPAMPLGDSDKLRVGEWVIAVGSPYGLSQTVTTGIISAKGRHNTGINSYENFLQTDAAINPGNSGGALLNLRGELVGINTAIFSRSGGYQGIGFAIPIGMARKISADLIRDGAVTRGWLGVSIQPLDPELAAALGVTERNGALVGGVVPGSPAEKAGVRRGDVITRIDKQAIPDPNTLLNHIALLPPGTWIELGLNRAGRALVLKARVTRRNDGPRARNQGGESAEDGVLSYASLGLELEALTRELRRDYGLAAGVAGIVVTVVEEGGRGDHAGLQEGDVVVEANRAKVRGPRDFQEALRKAGKDGRILLLVNRAGETFFTAL